MAPPAADPHRGIDKGVIEDANSGRGWLIPTALTAPAGTWSFSDYELFLVSASYSITNELTVGATTLIPIVKDQPFWALLSANMQVVKSGSLRLALHGAVTILTGGGESFSGGEVGGAATLCLDTHCHSHANLFVGGGFGISDSAGAVPILVGGSIVARLGKRVKLVGEVDAGYVAGGGINATSDGFLAWYGPCLSGCHPSQGCCFC